ncbi:Putative DNA-binding domain-containing protein [Bacillus sp. bc15]|uniref:AlbA family DNA-binding domain-containing protein n=1 Tax=Bacillus TaxID=1386 RepID=UPI00091B34CE|nr:ATP-binding protein [Bacillus sp. bc15]SHL24711.1 Putative DNA-binding domain-containing protein [Bacillus sp. bc15]
MTESSKLIELLYIQNESRNIEYKTTYNWNEPSHKAKITKTILAMSNIRDGGYLILGVRELENHTFSVDGMPQEHFELLNQDDLMSHINNYADPYVTFILHKFDIDNKFFAIFEVMEFEQVPVICKRDGVANLQVGAIYTRSRQMAATATVNNQAEMREIIDIAIEKGVRRLQQTIFRAGLSIELQQSEDEKFQKELGGL